jgi:hypothetical protein
MTYFKDLSEYAYGDPTFSRSGTKTVGWLGRDHDFPTKLPSDDILDLLWVFCSTSVALTRGAHDCEFCPSGSAYFAERNGQRLFLGAAEIRVFSEQGQIYAAPTLIYHYVQVHHYLPPDKFLEALRKGPRPPNSDYFECLERLGLTWSATSSGAGRRSPVRIS